MTVTNDVGGQTPSLIPTVVACRVNLATSLLSLLPVFSYDLPPHHLLTCSRMQLVAAVVAVVVVVGGIAAVMLMVVVVVVVVVDGCCRCCHRRRRHCRHRCRKRCRCRCRLRLCRHLWRHCCYRFNQPPVPLLSWCFPNSGSWFVASSVSPPLLPLVSTQSSDFRRSAVVSRVNAQFCPLEQSQDPVHASPTARARFEDHLAHWLQIAKSLKKIRG